MSTEGTRTWGSYPCDDEEKRSTWDSDYAAEAARFWAPTVFSLDDHAVYSEFLERLDAVAMNPWRYSELELPGWNQ